MAETFLITPIGYVKSSRQEVFDDDWHKEQFAIELAPEFNNSALKGLDSFSHVEVIFYLHKVDTEKIEKSARHPRNNKAWPKVGIFSQRVKNRPNRLGSTIAEIVSIHGTTIHLSGLDAIDGTPVIDIKPVMSEFMPQGAISQPAWSKEIMKGYWNKVD
ncbi:MAG: SAM-dependent methyltransferase [Deltaproteobacteria bacterium]|nr:SAM-dependent methyltransferase [Deltaproteobacteria bacterium]